MKLIGFTPAVKKIIHKQNNYIYNFFNYKNCHKKL